MRLALITTILLCQVDDEEEAASLAMLADKQVRLNTEHVLEMHGADRADLEGLMAVLPTQVTMLPDEMVEA